MNVIIGILSLLVLSECNLSRGDPLPVITTTNRPKKYDWSVLNNILLNMLKQTTPQPATSTLPPVNEETFSPRKETQEEYIARLFPEMESQPTSSPEHSLNHKISTSEGTETQEELIARLFQDMESQPASSPELSLNHKTSTSVYLSTRPPTTTSSPISVPRLHETLSSNNNAGSFLLPKPAYPQLESYYKPPSNHFQYSQPSAPQPFHHAPQEISDPFNTLSFYSNVDWISHVMPARSEPSYYFPSYTSEEIPFHSFHPVPYQNPLMPILTRDVPLSESPQVQNNPPHNHDSVPVAPLNGDIGADYGQSPFHPFLNNPPQTHTTPGHIVSTFVRSYIPQQQFHPLQFHVFQSPVVSSQPALYLPASPQLSQDDIISLIQKSQQPSSPGVISPALNLPSFPFQTFSNQPNFAPATTNIGKVSTPHSSVPIKSQAPLPYYREPRAPSNI